MVVMAELVVGVELAVKVAVEAVAAVVDTALTQETNPLNKNVAVMGLVLGREC